jgi:hypothetical protein
VRGFVKLTTGAEKTVVTEILQNVARRLASYEVPEALRVVDALPAMHWARSIGRRCKR